MSKNAELLAEDLRGLGFAPEPFAPPEEHRVGDGVKFEYRIEDGSRQRQTVLLGLALPDKVGVWPELAPHWVYVSPPDEVLAEQVRGASSPGVVREYEEDTGVAWMAISAPPSDFWDGIDTPGGKNMKTYLERHIRRIWSAR